MSKYLSKKLLLSFIFLNLFEKGFSAQKQIFKCSPQNQQSLCQDQNPLSVCAVDDDNQYLTFKSACEACSHEDTVSYTQGACKCPQIACRENQSCVEDQCVDINNMQTRDLVQIAKKLMFKQKNEQALKYINKIIQKRPQDSYPLYLGAVSSFGANKFEESLKYIKKAISIDSDIPEYFVIRGRAFGSLKQMQDAERQFQKALSMGFKDIGMIQFYRAQSLLTNKQTEEAIKKFEIALKYHPENTSWYVRKAMAHAINKQQRMAILTCRDGLKIDPNNKQIRQFMQQFEIMHEDKQKDLEDLQQNNLKAGNSTKGPDPEFINNFIKEKQQEQKMIFDQERFKQKQKKLEQEKKKTAQKQQL